MKKPLLEIKNLCTYFHLSGNLIKAVDGINLDIFPSEITGLVGESGSGKTVTAFSILKLITPPGHIESGEIIWNNENILALSGEKLRQVRGKQIAMIFQDPYGSFNPVFTIGDQIAEIIQLHQNVTKKAAFQKAIEMLEVVKIPDPQKRIRDYPHQFSGGMCQRAMLAMALSCQPKLLIADEPTTALDVTIQAQILDLLLEIKEKFKMSILLITHDLGIVAQVCDRVYVMQNGKIVEEGSTFDIFKNPQQLYTKNLLKAVPIPDPTLRKR
ncbi:MAG: ABC transporter ATP-binding protein [Candidatus Margulisbacteria bacterium]|nr:ABC transporter ATP-binding protein [Candidatus Margulisiibacteriota bacterium]